jgi:hypothetical protein
LFYSYRALVWAGRVGISCTIDSARMLHNKYMCSKYFLCGNIPHTITYANQSHSAPHYYQRSTTNQIQLLYTGQSVLTAAATSLGFAHQDLYKGHSSQPAMISDIQPVTASTSQSARLVQSDLSSESSALHCARDSCLSPPVVMPNSPGNWPPRLASGHTPHTHLLHAASPMSAFHDQAASQLLHCGQATPGNHCTATRQLSHATNTRTTPSLPAGTNSPFQGPTNFTEWIVYQNNDQSHTCFSTSL